ncbi:TetR/AcrR family transcriptional regulator [Cellulosimicrobium sp. CUA-896]|uniref:TetR/AcrR family transcriptional regulator n=1 Tax=Cellulosimicrobium sp. CUA-896 TaxID=1517881 RepID=UPI0009661709|nr:TetR/AcrR family transcriptional regulator [Cellulosimicrobium sp. CUA-896]OLT53396.1 hypothetical protein BJF88_11495 [Cellulosimicrobium sp. CUA-896]
MTFSATPAPRGSATKKRILEAADELFYEHGIKNVSIEDVVERASTTRMTLYRHFSSKDDLAVSFLQRRSADDRRTVESLTARAAGNGTEALMLLASAIGLETSAPSFRGCPFLSAAGGFRDPDHPVRRVVDDHRAWYRGMVLRLVRAAGVRDPAGTTDRIVMLRDGAMVRGYLGNATGRFTSIERAMQALLADGSPAPAGTASP